MPKKKMFEMNHLLNSMHSNDMVKTNYLRLGKKIIKSGFIFTPRYLLHSPECETTTSTTKLIKETNKVLHK